MLKVVIWELRNRLSEHLRMVRGGWEILITDHCKVVAEPRQRKKVSVIAAYPALVRHAQAGKAGSGVPKRPETCMRARPCRHPNVA